MSTTLKHSDKSFIESAAKAGTEEVAISQAALPHLTNPQVKDFAQMIVTDHTAANQELAELATRKGVTLPTKQPSTAKWEKANDKDYDEDYLEKMIKAHDDAVELFSKAAKKSEDPDVQAFAAKTLSTLEEHYGKAKQLKKALK